MLRKVKKEYLKNKLNNSIKIKKILKKIIFSSIIQNQSLNNTLKATYMIKYKLNYSVKTNLNDICLNSGVYKKSSRHLNFSRYEFHKLCRSNKLSSWITNSW